MTIRVIYRNGVFKPLQPVNDLDIKEGAEFEIEIFPEERKNKLKKIIGLFQGLSQEAIDKFEMATKRRPLFER